MISAMAAETAIRVVSEHWMPCFEDCKWRLLRDARRGEHQRAYLKHFLHIRRVSSDMLYATVEAFLTKYVLAKFGVFLWA